MHHESGITPPNTMFLCLKKLANTFTKTLVTFHPASSHMRRSPRGETPCSPEDPTYVRINPTLVVQWDDYPRGQRLGYHATSTTIW